MKKLEYEDNHKIDNINLFKADSFHYFVTSVLRQIAIKEQKDIQFNASLSKDIISKEGYPLEIFDAISFNGLAGLPGILVFEFKYVIKPLDTGSVLTKLYKRITEAQPYMDVTVVLITNQDYGQNGIINENLYSKIRTIIWDKSFVQKWITEYPIDFSNAISKFELTTQKSITTFAEVSEEDFSRKSKSNVEEIKRIIRSLESFAFVLGAGVSIDPGAKSWNELLKYFESELISKGIVNDCTNLAQKLGGSNIITAQLFKELCPKASDYFWAIHQGLYEDREVLDPDFALSHIARIIKKCKHKKRFRILTYNYDDYLESYLEDMGIDYNILYDSECTVNNMLSIYHVHGFLSNVLYKTHIKERYKKSICLTEEEYNNLYNNPYSWQISSQLSFFRENICLFVGCSLADPNIRRILEMTGREQKRHFAILTKDKMTTKDLLRASNHFSRLGIEVIWVEDFSDIRRQLKEFY